jgi:hypothetical protein
MIAEKDTEAVFNTSAIADLAKRAKLPAEADLVRFGDNVRIAVRAYFAERARTDWKHISAQLSELYRLTDRADPSRAAAAARLADHIVSIEPATRLWLERCALCPISFPSAEEITDGRTQGRAVQRLRRILSYGLEPVQGRKRSGGKRSRSLRPLLRAPGGKRRRRGRPRDLAGRELVQDLALTYLEATECPPPRRVSLATPGPFLRFVRHCFKLARIPAGNVVDLINERETIRRKLALRDVSFTPAQ